MLKIMEKFLIKSKTLVILDSGHGDDTPGKRSPVWSDGSQLFEWAFNRVIVKYISDYLKLGVSYIILVPENSDISFTERKKRMEKIYKDYGETYELIYLLSVHGNAHTTEAPNGIEVFTTKGITLADPIATKIYNSLKELGWRMRNDFSDGYPDKEANFQILRDAEKVGIPGILTENGFYTNKEECKKMLDFYWQKKIAQAHYNAIFKIEGIYLNGSKMEDFFV